MTRDPIRYSTIRKEPAYRPLDAYNLNAFYDKLIHPAAIVSVLVAFAVLLNQDLGQQLARAFRSDVAAWRHLALLALSVVAGMRLVQSLYLAKRDYAHLDSTFMDIFIFVALVLFTAGGALKLVQLDHLAAEGIYSVGALLGAANFWTLTWRIPRTSDHFDYPVERRIQWINTIVFLLIGVMLAWATITGYSKGGNGVEIFWISGACIVLLIINMIHSSQLTMLPKFLLTNEPDSPSAVADAFRREFGHLSPLRSDAEIAAAVLGTSEPRFQTLRLIRTGAQDADALSRALLECFGYVYTHLFGRRDPAVLQRMLRGMILSCGGFGALGYMSFYWLVNDEGHRVGFVKLDTVARNWFYRGLDRLFLPLRIAWTLRTLNLRAIGERARALLSDQPLPSDKELRITYLVVHSSHRRQGYGHAVLTLLRKACLRNFANDIVADRMTLFVRKNNVAALSCFRKAGFVEKPLLYENIAQDRLAVEGGLVHMELRD